MLVYGNDPYENDGARHLAGTLGTIIPNTVKQFLQHINTKSLYLANISSK